MEEVAKAQLPALPICDEKHFAQCLRVMLAALPRQAGSEISAELLLAAYRRKLGHMSKDQINFTVDKSLERCKWFPTIFECLEIAGEWERNDDALRARGAARAAVLSEKQQRMEEAMAKLDAGDMIQDELSALPEKWSRIADARGLVMWSEDGFVLRPKRTAD